MSPWGCFWCLKEDQAFRKKCYLRMSDAKELQQDASILLSEESDGPL